jgi:pyruvate/2-oxoglutarate dehydrogenase complex dihydrolipoamide dehydrogenase (E3) component
LAGVRYDAQKGIAVDRRLRTSSPRIYAAGDVTGGYRFTHAAALQARTAVRNALFPGRRALDERVMPWATFTEPEVAHVGLTEADARHRHGDRRVRVYTQPFRSVDRAITDGATAGFVKLVSTRDGELLGAQIVGAGAGEYINELALAMQQRIGLGELARTTHVYPTLALAIQQAAGVYSLERTARSRSVRLLRRLAH